MVKVVIPAAKEGRPHREYGFVHLSERATAVKLVDDAEKGVKPSLDGNRLEVGVVLKLLLLGPQRLCKGQLSTDTLPLVTVAIQRGRSATSRLLEPRTGRN